MDKFAEIAFARKRWDKEKMIAYGFQKIDNDYVLEMPFLNGDFKASLSVTDQGHFEGRVIDQMTQEDYYQLHQTNAAGAYVSTVRTAYLALLKDVADTCCREVLFTSQQANRLTKEIQERFQTKPDFPWAQDSRNQTHGVFRHATNQKWFALIMNIKRGLLDKDGNKERIDVINLKIQPEQGPALHQSPSIYPAYHMNHKTWISVVLDGSLPDEKVMELIASSYQLTK